jgi:hypothetical protein
MAIPKTKHDLLETATDDAPRHRGKRTPKPYQLIVIMPPVPSQLAFLRDGMRLTRRYATLDGAIAGYASGAMWRSCWQAMLKDRHPTAELINTRTGENLTYKLQGIPTPAHWLTPH